MGMRIGVGFLVVMTLQLNFGIGASRGRAAPLAECPPGTRHWAKDFMYVFLLYVWNARWRKIL